jgi:hypothetical protein
MEPIVALYLPNVEVCSGVPQPVEVVLELVTAAQQQQQFETSMSTMSWYCGCRRNLGQSDCQEVEHE